MTKIIDKPWGREEIWASVEDKYLGKYLIIEPGGKLSTQFHEVKDETVMCVKGKVFLILWDKNYRGYEVQMTLHYPYDIPAGVQHKMYCDDTEGGIVLEVSTYYPDDVVRVEDEYGRSSKDS
jgi:mannose-6-phosphate isomerase-like protein (cupin superfamily)